MKLNDRPKAGEKIVVFLLFLKQILTKILNLDSTDFGTEICVSSFQNFMELFETQFYWKQFQKLLSGNPDSQCRITNSNSTEISGTLENIFHATFSTFEKKKNQNKIWMPTVAAEWLE